MKLIPNSQKFRRLKTLSNSFFIIIDNIIHKYNPTTDTLEIDKISYKFWDPITEDSYHHNLIDITALHELFVKLENHQHLNNVHNSTIVIYLEKSYFYQEIAAAFSIVPSYHKGLVYHLNNYIKSDNHDESTLFKTQEGLILKNYHILDHTYDIVLRNWKQVDKDVDVNRNFKSYVDWEFNLYEKDRNISIDVHNKIENLKNKNLSPIESLVVANKRNILEFSQKVKRKIENRLEVELELMRQIYLRKREKQQAGQRRRFKWW